MQGLFGVFIGTFLIGLREGLEASLIVSIVGAFLKRNGSTVRPMFAGVAVAVLLSVAVGVGLDLFAASLPQAQQEMMETVINAIAVVFVTSMIIWMNGNAGQLKGELEREARQAVNRGGAFALAAMAFLAVLKEGFETSVFLLAAAETSHGNRWFAVLGGAVGILTSVGLGVGLYYGGLRINLARFFRVTGVFLVLIAAGLVLGALRAAHEAGWVSIGQQQVLDLSGWIPSNSVLGAATTGVFGIPADPRLIEVLGWLLYAVPVLVVFLWPARLAAAPRARSRLMTATSAVLLVVGAALTIMTPAASSPPTSPVRTVTDRSGHTAAVSLVTGPHGRELKVVAQGASTVRNIVLVPADDQTVDGVPVQVWQVSEAAGADGAPEVTLDQLLTMTGGRVPVGLAVGRTPGPFQGQWSTTTVYTVFARGDSVVSAHATSNRTALLTGGGLTGAKTVSLGGLATDWSTSAAEDHSTLAEIVASERHRGERQLWNVWLPLVLAGFALACALAAVASLRVDRRQEDERKSVHGESHRLGNVPVS
ncbi:high-affinity Fe2+/Pb2+ permease [Mycobacterium sp. 852002-51971_SCH5477799-a]|uniref:iron uptake transporter permease EfeU n=1 Tax=Mycobacterium sp. 852002-51971_SCH5477799-a TaxID=1834106 RepID=UPI0007FEDA4B|nr:iron uptake transporter permease EfeU [Mycobacterium sp. 852002-51971_SCH5477799-a]OBF61812.1 high-affinity Fe2+/Pb2+ permease [Mycobacterium sp. 852002-51971_SCH5477799-a]